MTYPTMWQGTPSNYVYYGSRDNLLWICTKILASSFSLLTVILFLPFLSPHLPEFTWPILLFFFPLSHMPVFPLYTTSLSKQSHTFCLLRRRWPMQLPTTHDRWWVDTGLFIAFLRSKGLLILLYRYWVVRLGLPMAENLKTSWQSSLTPTLMSPLLSIHDLLLLLFYPCFGLLLHLYLHLFLLFKPRISSPNLCWSGSYFSAMNLYHQP